MGARGGTGSTWIISLRAGRSKKSRNIGEFGEKQPPGSLGIEPAEKTGLRSGVLGMRSWERGFRAVYGAATTFPPPVPAGPCHPQRGWMSLYPHPWGQPSLWIGQGYGAGLGQPIPSHPILTFRVLPLFGLCRRTRPLSLSPSGLSSSSGGIISRDATSTGWEWGAGAGAAPAWAHRVWGLGDPLL